MRDNGRGSQSVPRTTSPRPAGSSGACGSGVPFQFPLAPVSTLARGIKFLNVAAVQCPHDTDAREHRWPSQFRHQHQAFNRSLPVSRVSLSLWKFGRVGGCIEQGNELAAGWKLNRIVKGAFPPACRSAGQCRFPLLRPSAGAVQPFRASIGSGIAAAFKAAVMPAMSTKSREVIFGSRIRGAKIRAERARKRAAEAAREADRAEAEVWSIRMEGYGGPAQPSPTIGQCLNGGLGWLEIECNRCKTRASLPLADIRWPPGYADLEA
jgi:hypothetical protein